MADKVLVGIVMGSDSDLETMQEATKILEKFGISYEVNHHHKDSVRLFQS
jgi:5-(carboxyamino)imidazole ribonucleotide mutase